MSRVNNKVLVTGGCGFIGSHTVVALIEKGFTPIIIDTLENSEAFILENLKKLTNSNISFYRGDCSNVELLDDVYSHEKFGSIIHFAAYKAVGESVQNPLKYYENNLQSLVGLLQFCEKRQIKDFVFSSSCTVYGQPKEIPVNENSFAKNAMSPYGFTKVICEQIIQDFYSSTKWFKPVLLRYFNPIGAHPSGLIGELPIGVPNNLVPFITQTARGIRNKLTVFGDDYSTPDGTCIRDYVHVCDIANAHVKALERINSFDSLPAIFNLGTGHGNSVLEVILTFEKTCQTKVNYSIGPRRDGDVESIYANCDKANQQLQWQCQYNLSDALQHAWIWENKYQEFLK